MCGPLCDSNKVGLELPFETQWEAPATFNEELPAPRATFIKAGWCLVSEWLSVQAQKQSGTA